MAKLLLTAYSPSAAAAPTTDLSAFVANDVRAHRAAALAQIGRGSDAIQELRAGMALARTPAEQENWKALTLAMGTSLADRATPPAAPTSTIRPPELTPCNGFTLDPRPWSMHSGSGRRAASTRRLSRRSAPPV